MSAARKLHRPEFVEQLKSLENSDKRKLLKEIDRLQQYGWRLHSFGYSNGFQGGWYAVLVMQFGA